MICMVCAGNEIYRSQANQLTPISKRRKAYSMCEDSDYAESDRLKQSLNEALREVHQYKKMVRISLTFQLGFCCHSRTLLLNYSDYIVFVGLLYF